MDYLSKVISLPFKCHLLVGFVVRVILILYGEYHDRNFEVPYTDVDYKVFSDASKHVFKGSSPYNRHTYRYSPVIAYLLIPNLFIPCFGKVLFSLADVVITILINIYVKRHLYNQNCTKSKLCSLMWLYNPLSIGISTRGNADSISCLLILLNIFILQSGRKIGFFKCTLSGIVLGFCIHLRLYPLFYSLPMYLSLGEYKITRNTSIREGVVNLFPNLRQTFYIFSCVSTFLLLTGIFYSLYGYEFLFETYIYHLFRKDIRHNFSIHFYYSYLTADQIGVNFLKAISRIFEMLILFTISVTFGREARTLVFGLFCQTVILVAYNSVITSQYFIWFLALLPLTVCDIRLKAFNAIALVVIWASPQIAWLYYAYLLEFECQDTFLLIWIKTVLFFCANVYVLSRLVESYSPGCTSDKSM